MVQNVLIPQIILPDYEIIEVNESNLDLTCNEFVSRHIKIKNMLL